MDPRRYHRKRTMLSPKTQRAIRWQVYLPLFIGLLVLVGLAIWLWPDDTNASTMADVSVTCLTVPLLILGVMMVVILIAALVATEKVIQGLPAPMRQLHRSLTRLESTAKRGSNMAARPMMTSLAAWAGVQAFFRGVASIFDFDEETRDE